MAEFDQGLRERLAVAGVDPAERFRAGEGSLQIWLRLRDRFGRRATLVDLYQLEAASLGLLPDELTVEDRKRLIEASRNVRRFGPAEVIPGSDRTGDRHEVVDYDPAWPEHFTVWSDRLATHLGPTASRIEHVGSTSVPGLAAKPIIDVQISVASAEDENSYLHLLESAGLILRLREPGHLFLWPRPGRPREVHVHVCEAGGSWEHDHLLFRDYLRAHPDACAAYATLKQHLMKRWHNDRKAYGEAKTGFILDTLDAAADWAVSSGWEA